MRTAEQKALAAKKMRDWRRTKSVEYRRSVALKYRAYGKAWIAANRDRSYWYQIKSNYGLTREQYEAAIAAQGGLCLICKKLPRKKERLVIDHDHKTNKVRGLLCRWCNMALGSTEESITTLQDMIQYIKEHAI